MDNNLNNQLLDSVPDGVFTVDAEWRITSFNRAAEQITGIQRAGSGRSAVLRSLPRQHLRDAPAR